MARVLLKNVRLAFPSLFEPRDFNGEGKKVFSALFIMEKEAEAVQVLRRAMMEAATQKWQAKAKDIAKSLKAGGKVPLRDGDEKSEIDGFAGNLFVSARTNIRPLVIDRDKTPLTENDGKPYSGCFVNAMVEVWAQDNAFGKRINCTLLGVQFAKDGDAFGGGGAASPDDFEQLAPAPAAKPAGADFVEDYEAHEDDDLPDFI